MPLAGAEPLSLLMYVVVFAASLTFHEFSHALAAKLLGDDTAERAGRLTLNPIPHIDPIGFLAVFAVGFGWAKPVPYNPYNLRDQKWGPVLVGAAGPFSNLLLAFAASLAVKTLSTAGSLSSGAAGFLGVLILLNVGLAVFNLIPVPPLDGSKLLLAALDHPRYARARFLLETRGPLILLLIILADGLLFDGLIFGRILGGLTTLVLRLFGMA